MISIIIPSFNGQALFDKYLAKNMAFFNEKGITDIVIADDASTDESVAYIRETFPDITLVVAEKNTGFSATANMGAKAAKGDILFFLNNDMAVTELDVDRICTYLDRDDVFAVGPTIKRPKLGMETESVTYGFYKGGWLYTESKLPKDMDPPEGHPLLWACGGALFTKADRFWELGGFDLIYRPFYVDDMGLSLKAWKRGWRSIHNSSSLILHEHQASIGSYYSQRQITQFHLRNKYTLIWQHLQTRQEWLMHAWWILKKILRLEFVEWAAMVAAFKRREAIKERRAWLREHGVLTNKEIFAITKKPT